MDGVVGLVSDRDQKFRVENAWISTRNISDGHRIHVMDVETMMNVIAVNPQITSIVPMDDMPPDLTPFCRSVEPLIDVSIETERILTGDTSQTQILKSFIQCVKTSKLGIPSNPHSHAFRNNRSQEDCLGKSAWRREPWYTSLRSVLQTPRHPAELSSSEFLAQVVAARVSLSRNPL